MPAAIETHAQEIRTYKGMVEQDPTLAERSPRVVARWVGGDGSRVECDGATISLGGEGNLTPMDAVLAALAACDVDVVATHAALLGLEVESLTVEATGHFDLRSYLGLEDAPGPGFDSISYVIHVAIPNATPEQMRHLQERCERSSPVADSLARAIPLRLRFTRGDSTNAK